MSTSLLPTSFELWLRFGEKTHLIKEMGRTKRFLAFAMPEDIVSSFAYVLCAEYKTIHFTFNLHSIASRYSFS